jgi:hypothetical protein
MMQNIFIIPSCGGVGVFYLWSAFIVLFPAQVKNVPKSWDWRNANPPVLTPIQDQGQVSRPDDPSIERVYAVLGRAIIDRHGHPWTSIQAD